MARQLYCYLQSGFCPPTSAALHRLLPPQLMYSAGCEAVMDTTEQAPPEFGVRVFLVEDNPEHSFIAVTVIRQVLGDASEVIVAENADEAVELIQQFTDTDRPDLMLVDLRLPDNGGFAVLSAARAHDPCSHVPMFVITS